MSTGTNDMYSANIFEKYMNSPAIENDMSIYLAQSNFLTLLKSK